MLTEHLNITILPETGNRLRRLLELSPGQPTKAQLVRALIDKQLAVEETKLGLKAA